MAITNNGTNVTPYKYDAAGQLTNKVCLCAVAPTGKRRAAAELLQFGRHSVT